MPTYVLEFRSRDFGSNPYISGSIRVSAGSIAEVIEKTVRVIATPIRISEVREV